MTSKPAPLAPRMCMGLLAAANVKVRALRTSPAFAAQADVLGPLAEAILIVASVLEHHFGHHENDEPAAAPALALAAPAAPEAAAPARAAPAMDAGAAADADGSSSDAEDAAPEAGRRASLIGAWSVTTEAPAAAPADEKAAKEAAKAAKKAAKEAKEAELKAARAAKKAEAEAKKSQKKSLKKSEKDRRAAADAEAKRVLAEAEARAKALRRGSTLGNADAEPSDADAPSLADAEAAARKRAKAKKSAAANREHVRRILSQSAPAATQAAEGTRADPVSPEAAAALAAIARGEAPATPVHINLYVQQ